MSILPQLIPIELNSEKRQKIVLTNLVKMLTTRGVLNKDTEKSTIEKLINKHSDDLLFEIVLDNPTIYYKDVDTSKKILIKIINQKITGISKSSLIGDFLFSNKDSPKIVIVQSISTKAREQVSHDFPYSEVFLEKELLINLVEHISVPKHELLNNEDAKKTLEEYGAKKKEMPRIFITDPLSRYFNAKIGQIFRIIRPSETAVESPYHRLVIKGGVMSS
jgi:DNA-directed RNA polymerase I, II, and III subunit RPABC1